MEYHIAERWQRLPERESPPIIRSEEVCVSNKIMIPTHPINLSSAHQNRPTSPSARIEMPLLVTLAMPIADLLQQTRFLTNNLGEQTDVVIPIDTWNTVLALVESFQSIDDAYWVQQAEQTRNSSAMVGTELFTQEVKRLASLDVSIQCLNWMD
jgi:hypothetical protein